MKPSKAPDLAYSTFKTLPSQRSMAPPVTPAMVRNTPLQFTTSQKDKTNPSASKYGRIQTPLTVRRELRMNNPMRIAQMTQDEVGHLTSWVKSQIGDLKAVNQKIDMLNAFLQGKEDGRISKKNILDLCGEPYAAGFILMLTNTNRVESTWEGETSMYVVR